MNDIKKDNDLTRREVLGGAIKLMFAASALPLTKALDAAPPAQHHPCRAINIMNFIRAEEPREPMDLMEPVRKQMEHIKAHNLPATWLLQYDALVEGPFVAYLKSEMPVNHEVGIWFEMNRRICDDAGVAWRGNPNWEWDYHVPVAYSIGYTPAERRKLADTAMKTFRRVFGHDVKSIASWNLDAITIAHLSDHYDIDAFGNCRDQLATDGFTIWGAPIAAYYPNRNNAWSPAVEAKNQISTPMFRLLGQDPVYYYDNKIPYPDTMEPVWASGQSKTFVDNFLNMIAYAPTQAFAYGQLGQENSFGWPQMSEAYPMQMQKLAKAVKQGGFIVETMGETGRRFKKTFSATPTQAQVMLEDPFGHGDTAGVCDVTGVVKSMVQGNTLTVTSSNRLGGDPAPGQHKELRISYTLDGVAHNQSAAELAQIHIPASGETPGRLAITHASFGTLGRAPERTVWYQSRYLRANLHLRGSEFYLRDLHVYHDDFQQPFLTETVKEHGIEQRLLAVLDGYHWSGKGGRAMGRFVLVGHDGVEKSLALAGRPHVTESGTLLQANLPLENGGVFKALFRERDIECSVHGTSPGSRLALIFEWEPSLSALREVTPSRLDYSFRDFNYSVTIDSGKAVRTDNGAKIVAAMPGAPLRLRLAQPS